MEDRITVAIFFILLQIPKRLINIIHISTVSIIITYFITHYIILMSLNRLKFFLKIIKRFRILSKNPKLMFSYLK